MNSSANTSVAGPTLMLASTQPEVAPVARALGVNSKAVHIHTPQWLLVQAGIGGQRVLAALHKSVRQKQVSRVIHFGYAGGLSPALQPGEIVKVTSIAEPSGRVIALDEPVPRVLKQGQTPPEGQRLLSVPYMVHRPADKQRMFTYHQAAAVDMESFTVAQACAQLNLPYVCLRAISDPADMALPAGSDNWLDHEGHIRHGRVIRFVLSHPGWIGQLSRLGKYSKAASASLTQAVLQELNRKDGPARTSTGDAPSASHEPVSHGVA